MIPASLTPGVRAESEGPTLIMENGLRVLYYAFASFVFRWAEGTSQLDIGRGRIDQYVGLHTGVTITGVWSRERLAKAAQEWVRREHEKHSDAAP